MLCCYQVNPSCYRAGHISFILTLFLQEKYAFYIHASQKKGGLESLEEQNLGKKLVPC